MFFSLSNFFALLILLLSFMNITFASTAKTCNKNNVTCQVDFVPPLPVITGLTTAACTAPVTKTYTIMNYQVPVPQGVTLENIFLIDNDNLGPNAVQILFLPGDCQIGQKLAKGASCKITLSFQPCVAGNLNRKLVIDLNTSQGSLKTDIQTTVTSTTTSPMAYITNNGNNTISLCAINPDGVLSSCNVIPVTTAPGPDEELNGPAYMILNPAGTFAYISNFSCGDNSCAPSYITICPVNSDGSLGSIANPCTSSFGFGTISIPNGLVFNSTGTVLYVTNGGTNGPKTVSACIVNPTNGSLTSCTESGSVGSAPNGIVLNNNDTLGYIVDFFDNTVAICTINPTNGAVITLCVEDTASGELNAPDGITFNPAGTIAYITNDGDFSASCDIVNGPSITYCTLMPDGSFDICNQTLLGCTPTFCTLGAPAGIEVTNTYAYISNVQQIGTDCDESFAFTVCPIETGGSLGTCNLFPDATFNIPNDIFIVP